MNMSSPAAYYFLSSKACLMPVIPPQNVSQQFYFSLIACKVPFTQIRFLLLYFPATFLTTLQKVWQE